MISSTLVWLFVITLGIIWYFGRKKYTKQGYKEIPGPLKLPIVGNIFQLGKLPHIKLTEWSKQYGDICHIAFGPQQVILVSDPKLLKELYSTDPNYVGRSNMEAFETYEGERLGLVNSEGELWEVHRRFLLRQLRDFGFGKSAMEALIMEEIDESIKRFKKDEGKPVTDIKKMLTIAVVNSLWSVLSSERFSHDDPKLLDLATNTDKVLDEVFNGVGGMIITMFPYMKKIAPELIGYNKLRRTIERNRTWFEGMVEEHKQNLQEDNLRDFMDVYLSEVKKTTDPNSVFYGKLAERQLVTILADLFFAGTETTASTLAYAVLYLCKNPEKQKKLQNEISSITNNSRNVSVADRPNMPYTLAVMDEVFRMSSIVPVGVQHRTLEDKEFHGYYIRKDSWVNPNLHWLHHNPKIWGDPDNFRPERFLSADEKKYQKNENLLPFQIGRRQCVGEILARDTIFLYLTNVFQRFSMCFDPSKPEPSDIPKPAMVLHPDPFSVVMTDRLH